MFCADGKRNSTSGRYVGLKLAKSVRSNQFQDVTITFSDLISPWQTLNSDSLEKICSYYTALRNQVARKIKQEHTRCIQRV